MGLDSRIGPRFLRPGIGYGGSCFPKDVAAFRSVADQLGIDFNLLTEVEKINAAAEEALPLQGALRLWTLRGKRLGVLGLAFKGETDDIRESPAIDLVEMLLAEGCSIAAYDPAAMKRAQQELPAAANFATSRTPTPPPRRRRPARPHRLGRVRRPRPQAPLHRHALPHRRRRPQPLRPQGHAQHGFTYISIGRPAVYPARDGRTRRPRRRLNPKALLSRPAGNAAVEKKNHERR
jgi:UDPglucose 6-dehydrogenase